MLCSPRSGSEQRLRSPSRMRTRQLIAASRVACLGQGDPPFSRVDSLGGHHWYALSLNDPEGRALSTSPTTSLDPAYPASLPTRERCRSDRKPSRTGTRLGEIEVGKVFLVPQGTKVSGSRRTMRLPLRRCADPKGGFAGLTGIQYLRRYVLLVTVIADVGKLMHIPPVWANADPRPAIRGRSEDKPDLLVIHRSSRRFSRIGGNLFPVGGGLTTGVNSSNSSLCTTHV
jgi:hypothetical protein